MWAWVSRSKRQSLSLERAIKVPSQADAYLEIESTSDGANSRGLGLCLGFGSFELSLQTVDHALSAFPTLLLLLMLLHPLLLPRG